MAIKKPAKKRPASSKRAKLKPLNGVHLHDGLVNKKAKTASNPWEKYAGMFAGDPVFEGVIKNVAEKRKQRRNNPEIP